MGPERSDYRTRELLESRVGIGQEYARANFCVQHSKLIDTKLLTAAGVGPVSITRWFGARDVVDACRQR